MSSGAEDSGIPAQEEGEEDISGTQFVCETVIRSLTLEEAPDHTPMRASCSGAGKQTWQNVSGRKLAIWMYSVNILLVLVSVILKKRISSCMLYYLCKEIVALQVNWADLVLISLGDILLAHSGASGSSDWLLCEK